MLLPLVIAGLLAAGQPQSPLAGPAVGVRAMRPTLVSYDMNGRLRRLEASPEVAAIGLLHLSPDAQTAVDRVAADHAAAIDRFVSENLLLLGQLDTASKAGGKLDQFSVLIQVLQKVRPALEGLPLRERIAAALPADDAGKFRGLVLEYWGALVADGLRENRAQGKYDAPWAVGVGERIRLLAEEVTRSYERQAAMGTLFFDYVLADLNLTPAQRETVRGLELDMLEQANFRPSEEDQKKLGLGILAYLDAHQRRMVLKKIMGK
jgi:hypothetical protein